MLAAPELPRARFLHPFVVGGILAVLCTPLATTLPAAGLDPSWQVGLSLAASRSIPAGTGILFTYGPFGFVAAPNLVWLPGVVLGIVYALAAAFALYTLSYCALLRWLPPSGAVAGVALIAIVAAAVRAVPEMVTLATVVAALQVVDARRLAVRLPLWIPAAFGAIAAVQLPVKFSVGLFGVGVAFVVALARPRRFTNVGVTIGAFLVTLTTLWIALSQPLSAFGPWVRGSFDSATGYSAAMAVVGEPSARQGWIIMLAGVAVIACGAYVLASRDRLRALPALLLLAATTWFVVKEGFVRLDSGHAATTFLGLVVLTIAIPWPRRRLVVGVAGAVLALLGLVIVGFSASGTPFDGTQELARSLRATVDSGYRDDRLAEARHELRSSYDLPPKVVAALRGHRVHADPWDIAAVWAYDLKWEPLPVFQTYLAYTPYLDEHNAARLLRSPRLSVLRHQDTAVDQRVPAWESPAAMLALTCDYDVAATARHWEALTPGADRCGAVRELGSVTVEPGEVIRVPRPSSDTSVVVARFDVTESPVDRLTASALKPRRLPTIEVDGEHARFVLGTAAEPHLLVVPERVGDAVPANEGLDVRRLTFHGVGGRVTVQFAELALS